MIVVIPKISILLPTLLTAVRFDSCVNLHVGRHIIRLAEAFSADFTAERLLSGVNAFVPA